jgi:RNase P subunit RPR2
MGLGVVVVCQKCGESIEFPLSKKQVKLMLKTLKMKTGRAIVINQSCLDCGFQNKVAISKSQLKAMKKGFSLSFPEAFKLFESAAKV